MPGIRRIRTSDFEACPCSGRNLPKLVQPLILALLRRGPMHGYAIAARLAAGCARPAAAPKHPGIYRILRRMESRGLLRSRSEPAPAGPPRRVYSITVLGAACLRSWIAALTRLRRDIDSLLRVAGPRRQPRAPPPRRA